MLKKILGGIAAVLAVLIVVFLGVVAMQPSRFRVERTTTMSAPPGRVFAQVNDFHKWEAWSPWAKLDPAAKNTFEGPSEGTGASFHWSGNDEVGEGKMTILESRPGEMVRIKLDFVKPFASTCDINFTLKPEGDRTTVTWGMAGANSFICKAMCLFMDMDKMVGGMYEKGLAQMKTIVEAPVAQADADPGLTTTR